MDRWGAMYRPQCVVTILEVCHDDAAVHEEVQCCVGSASPYLT